MDLLWAKSDPNMAVAIARPAEALITEHIIAIDTGGGTPDGKLIALLLPERKLYRSLNARS